MMTWPFAWPEALKLKGPLGWGLASLACFIVFLFLTFPYGPLQNRLLTELNRASGWEVRAADWSVGFPVAIEWHDVVLAGPTIGAIPLEAVRTTIGVFQAFLGRLVIDYAVQLPGVTQAGAGRATGSLTAASWSLRGPVAVKGHLQQMDLATVLKPYVSRGTVQGDFMHRWDNAQGAHAAIKGEGTVKVEIKDLVSRTDCCRHLLDSLAYVRPHPSRARLPRCSLRCDGIEGRRCGWIVYGPGAHDVAAAAAAEPSGSHGHRDSRRRICPKSGEPLVAAVPARDPLDVQAGGADHECESGALSGHGRLISRADRWSSNSMVMSS